MPRTTKPRWREKRKRWSANIGEVGVDGRRREVFAPASIGEKDEEEAWAWFRAEKERIESEVVDSSPDDPKVAWVCEHYLAWAEARKAEGKLPASEYANKARHLGLFADALGRRSVSKLTADDMTAYGEQLVTVFSPTYARNVCATARAAFNWAARPMSGRTPSQLIASNPIRGFKAPTIPRSPARFAERQESRP